MNRGKRLDIQALRAIAVLSVVVYHLWPGKISGGFMGVDIFFVISGYLMTSTLMRDAQPVLKAKNKMKATGQFLSNFYARRIKRLVPAASLTLLATLGLVLATGNLALIQETAIQISASALFFQNWYLANNSVDYLANSNPTAVQHFWSLSLEEQFYLIWPLLLVLLLFVTTSLYISYKNKKVANFAVVPIALLVALFFVYGYQLTQTQPSLAYFVTPARVWELLIGGVIAFLPLLRNYDMRLLLPWVGFAMIGYALFRWDGAGFPGWHALFPTVGTALIIYAGGMAGESKWSFEHLLRFRPIQWLGNLSYSLYLWHWPLIVLLPVLFFIDMDSRPQGTFTKIGILLLSLLIAQLSYRYVEQSAQHIKMKKRYVFSLFVVITAVVAGLGYFTSHHAEATMRNAVIEARASAYDDSNACLGAKSIVNKCENSFGYINSAYSQIGSNDRYDYILSQSLTCSSYTATKITPKINDFCTVGDLNSERQITVWGDSHAQHWINPLDKIGKKHAIKFNIIGTSACFGSTQNQENCDSRFEHIKQTDVFDKSEAIIVSMWHSNEFENKGNNIVNAVSELAKLSDNKNLYLIEDVPSSGKEGGPTCTILRLSCKEGEASATDSITKDSNDVVELGLFAPDKIIPVKDMFCDDTYCYSTIGGVPVYRDHGTKSKTKGSINSHMTSAFAYSTWPLLEQKLIDAGIIEQ